MIESVAIVGVIAVLGLMAYRAFRPRAGQSLPVPSAILPAAELQRRYGLYAENRPAIRLDPHKVPSRLQDLIPLAETWGIGDDVIRFDFGQKAPEALRSELVTALSDRVEEVEEWLRSQPRGAQLSDEAEAFMYMLSAWAEVRPIDPA